MSYRVLDEDEAGPVFPLYAVVVFDVGKFPDWVHHPRVLHTDRSFDKCHRIEQSLRRVARQAHMRGGLIGWPMYFVRRVEKAG